MIRMATFPAALLLSTGIAEAGLMYSITDLGTPPGYEVSEGWGINASGEVTGALIPNLNESGEHDAAFINSGGVFTLLPTIGGSSINGLAINANGDVTGDALTAAGADRAFLYSGGVTKNLGVLPGYMYSVGTAINDSDEITGEETTSGEIQNAFLYKNGTMTSLGTPAGYSGSVGFAINNAGQIAGRLISGTNAGHAFLYSNGVMTDLGVLPGYTESVAQGINSSGDVTGQIFALSGEPDHPFLYKNGTMIDLGLPSRFVAGVGSAINDSDEIVGAGTKSIATGDTSAALIYTDGAMYDLNSLINPALGWQLTYAYGINDAGQITGIGQFDGVAQAYLLTPVPEPSSVVLVGLGGAGLLTGRWRKRRRAAVGNS